uniref:TNP2 transposase n=1 Tax=Oryza sativa subsp. japonica TaxID=39947 RepID=Q8S5R2_ORYSJ|nr:Putative TNP2 transposase [Oryza sativa Japonica Group]
MDLQKIQMGEVDKAIEENDSVDYQILKNILSEGNDLLETTYKDKKWKYIMMLIITQELEQPGNDIDVYLRSLVEDLKLLWKKEGAMCGRRTNKSNLTYERCSSSPLTIALHLTTYLDNQTRGITKERQTF